jgi:hypothetical protein
MKLIFGLLGGYVYSVCPKANGQALTEECFTKHTLPFVGDKVSVVVSRLSVHSSIQIHLILGWLLLLSVLAFLGASNRSTPFATSMGPVPSCKSTPSKCRKVPSPLPARGVPTPYQRATATTAASAWLMERVSLDPTRMARGPLPLI